MELVCIHYIKRWNDDEFQFNNFIQSLEQIF